MAPPTSGLRSTPQTALSAAWPSKDFTVGVSIPSPTDVGDLIQGNFVGEYLAYPVDPETGVALPAPNNVELIGQGNTQQGVVLGSLNTTLGGTDPQDDNVIAGNGDAGRLDRARRVGQPGFGQSDRPGRTILHRPVLPGGQRCRGGADRVVGNRSDPASIVYASSNIIGGAVAGAGNLISDNLSDGVHIEGVGATRNLVEANDIGLAPGGGYVFGDGQPGNGADGVWIDDAPDNQVGGADSSDGNVISSNAGNGVNITGSDALGNTVDNNIIGLTAAGSAVLGNDQAGVADTAPGTMIGPGNVISANLIGVLISGAHGHPGHSDRQPDWHRFVWRSRSGQRRGGGGYRKCDWRDRRGERPGLAGHLG